MRTVVVLSALLATTHLRAAPVDTLQGHEGPVAALAFSPNGERLLSVAEDGRILVWDMKTRKIVHRSEQKDEKQFAAAWRPDGAQFATAGQSGTVRLWAVGGEKPVKELKRHTGPVAALAFSPDGATLASGGYARTIRLWSTGNDPLTEFLEDSPIHDMDGRVTSLAFTGDGHALVVGTVELTELRSNGELVIRYAESGFVRVYNVRTRDRDLIRKLDVRGSQVAVAGDRVLAAGSVGSWQPEGKMLDIGGGSMVSVADLKTGKALARVSGAGLSAAWSKDGAVLACGGYCYRHYPGNILLCTTEGKPGGTAYSTNSGAGAKVTTTPVDPRERGPGNVFTGVAPPLALRDRTTLKKGRVIDQKDVECLAVSPDGKFIAVGESGGAIRVHPTAEMK